MALFISRFNHSITESGTDSKPDKERGEDETVRRVMASNICNCSNTYTSQVVRYSSVRGFQLFPELISIILPVALLLVLHVAVTRRVRMGILLL